MSLSNLLSSILQRNNKANLSTLFTQSKRYLSNEADKKQTCLYGFHRKRQARMEEFAGYLMPIVYKNQTIKSEHMQTRELASAFDVSHMMQTIVRGKDRVKFLESLTVTDIEGLGNRKCSLSLFTTESGGILDDCIIAKHEDHLHIVSNAGNADLVWSWLTGRRPKDLDVHLERLDGKGLIALQGPKSSEVLQNLVDTNLAEIGFMNTSEMTIKDCGKCVVTRCGYTGEDGFEISVDSSVAETLMDTLCNNNHVKPAGLGARDTLRLEAGLCLHGNDMTDKTSPVEAGLSWTIHKRRREEGGFLGSSVILEQLKRGTTKKRIGLVATGSGPPARHGSQVKSLDGKTVIGDVTSGTFSPVLSKNVAMAYLSSGSVGQKVKCCVREKDFEYEITKMPFVKCNYYFKK